MIRFRSFASSFAFATLLIAPMTTASVDAGDYIYGGVYRIGDRCARLGEGFTDNGNGVCERVSGHVRVGTSNNATGGWTTGGTSNAAMRSTGPSLLPGAEITQRLRVRGDLDSASPFR